LGLFISKNIIEAHDGMIWAENNNGDFIGNSTGATFVSNLPIRTERRNHFGYFDNIKKTFKKYLWI
jgi:signal transduction histidine kinase